MAFNQPAFQTDTIPLIRKGNAGNHEECRTVPRRDLTLISPRFIDYVASRRPLRRRQNSTRGMAMAAAATGITQSGITREKFAVSLVNGPRVAVI